MTTLQIKYRDIPFYLHAGDFYRSLDSDDPEGIIEIPADCFHQDGKTAPDICIFVEEFRQLLRVMVFWMLDEIPVGILHFCNKHSVEKWDQSIADLPGALKQTVQPLLLSMYSKSERVGLADVVNTDRWDLIMYAVSQTDKKINNLVTVAAAQCGHLRLLQYLHENGFIWDNKTSAAASRDGHLDCLQYAHENGCPWDVEVFKGAARNGHLNCMQYAYRQGLREWHKDVCMYAASHGHLDCLEYAYDNGCPWEYFTTLCAAQKGHFRCLQYALERGCPVDSMACEMACRGGHLECLQLVHQSGIPCNKAYYAFRAAQNPTIVCLQYLYEHDCPWDEKTSCEAAWKGHCEPLRYALEHGCLYDVDIVQRTVIGKNLTCLQLVVEDQILYLDKEVFKVALLRGDLANLQYLLDQGCPFLEANFNDYGRILDNYVDVYCPDNPQFVLCVQFAVERGWVPCSNFIQFVSFTDESCSDWLIKEGFYSNDDESISWVYRD